MMLLKVRVDYGYFGHGRQMVLGFAGNLRLIGSVSVQLSYPPCRLDMRLAGTGYAGDTHED